jgi:hypothetical protein
MEIDDTVESKDNVTFDSPISSLAKIKSINYKPFVMIDTISLSPSELLFIFNVLKEVFENDSSSISNLPRDITDAINIILESDMINTLQSREWDSKFSIILSNKFAKSSFNDINDLLSPQDIEEEEEIFDNNDLSCVNWLINASRLVLKQVYDEKELNKSKSSVRELISLNESILSKNQIISICVQDYKKIQLYSKLVDNYRTQLEILLERRKFEKKNYEYKEGREKEEFYLVLTKAYMNQMKIEKEIELIGLTDINELNNMQNSLSIFTSALSTSNSHKSPSPSTCNNQRKFKLCGSRLNHLSEDVSSSGDNPLLVVMQSVFQQI